MRIVLLLVLAPLFSSPCVAGSIGLYASQDGMGCNISLPQNSVANIYAIAISSDSDPNGGLADGGEFRVIGLPAGWVAQVSPAEGITQLGDLFGDGAGFFWYPPRVGQTPLCTISVVALSEVDNVLLQVVKHVNPNPPFGFPTTCQWLHYHCGDPCDTSGVCAGGVPLTINGSCTVAVAQSTWTSIRELYR